MASVYTHITKIPRNQTEYFSETINQLSLPSPYTHDIYISQISVTIDTTSLYNIREVNTIGGLTINPGYYKIDTLRSILNGILEISDISTKVLQPTHFSFSHSTLATFPSIQQAELNRSLQHSCGDIPRQCKDPPYQACSFGEGRRVHEHKDSHSLGIVHNHSDNHNDDGRILPWIPHSMNCRAQSRLASILLHHHIPLLLLPHDISQTH